MTHIYDHQKGDLMRKATLGILLISILSVCSVAQPQIAPPRSAERKRLLRQATNQLQGDLEQIRRLLAPGVEPSELPVLNSIKFRVPDGYDDDFINCFAGREPDGTREVFVGLGFTQALRMFIDSQLLARALNDPAKGKQYVEYVRDKWQENLARSRVGEDPVAVESPNQYFRASDGLIDAIAHQSNGLYTGSLSFAVAHEVGHHVLGDQVARRVHSLEEEKRADDWAMKTMVAAGQPPTAGIMVLAFFASFFLDDPSHPSTDERATDMIRVTLTNLDHFAAQARANGVSIEAYRAQLIEGLRQLTNSDSAPSENPQSAGTFLDAVRQVVNDVPSRFSDLLGDVESQRTSSVGHSTVYTSKVRVPQFDKCTIAVEDFRHGPRTEFWCRTDGGGRQRAWQVFSALVPPIRQISSWGWRVTNDDASSWRAIRTGSGGERLSISLDFFDDKDPDRIFTSLSVRIYGYAR